MPTKKTPPTSKEASISLDETLAAEFNYIANSAFQANEDRSKSASFFLVSVGSLIAAIFGAQELGQLDEIPTTLYILLALVFFVLTFLGALTVAQLARLRVAWYESALAMNQIKAYLIETFPDLQLGKAFRWRADTLPALYKTNSIAYYTVIEVAVLSGFTFSAGVFFLQLGMQYTTCLWPFTITFGSLAAIGQLFLYKKMLTRKKQ